MGEHRRAMGTCTDCGRERMPIAAKGLCARCYKKRWTAAHPSTGPARRRVIATCSSCGREEMPIAAKGYCRACYSRWRRNGDTGYKVRRYAVPRGDRLDPRLEALAVKANRRDTTRATLYVDEPRAGGGAQRPPQRWHAHALYRDGWKELEDG